MSTWKEWGVYATTIEESGTQPPSPNLNWNRIENDQYYPVGNEENYFGPGLGCIQITSGQISFLKQLKAAGLLDNRYDTYLNSSYPLNFNNDDVAYLQGVLSQDQSIEIQRAFTVDYFDGGNSYAMNAIETANCPDIVKAYIVNMVILYPSYAYTLAQNPVGQTLAEAQNQMLQLLPDYAGRFKRIRDYLETIDINTTVPYSFWLGGTTANQKPDPPENSTPAPSKPRPPQGSGDNDTNTDTNKNNVVLSNGYFSKVLNTMQFIGKGKITFTKMGNGENYLYRLPKITGDTIKPPEETKPTPAPDPPPATKPPVTPPSNNVDVSWLNQFLGQQINYTNQQFGFGQCVAAGWFWLQHLGLNVNALPNVNYAAEIQNLPWGTPPYDGFTCLTNTNQVKAGDCVGFSAPWAPLPVGHYIIAADDADSNGNFRFYEQNWNFNQPSGQILRLAPNPIDTQYPSANIISIVRKQ